MVGTQLFVADDYRVTVEGNKVVGREMHDGVESVIKHQLVDAKSPEHAEIWAAFFNDPWFMLLAASGKLTDDVINKAAEELRTRRSTTAAAG